eukprot:CAMPEP_0174906126 /NCGR_PEP_ID=MMETSP0167-20121228/55821_1 /TAXON_ID=38298 /ORGANISM="Rhodella maculata, Strain CCMP736" /LENGTH=56 /DNA_ID=CAMNT_0016149293 /DNA_START=166 /DNA_END=333 /DNA_ORIENTATION=-
MTTSHRTLAPFDGSKSGYRPFLNRASDLSAKMSAAHVHGVASNVFSTNSGFYKSYT